MRAVGELWSCGVKADLAQGEWSEHRSQAALLGVAHVVIVRSETRLAVHSMHGKEAEIEISAQEVGRYFVARRNAGQPRDKRSGRRMGADSSPPPPTDRRTTTPGGGGGRLVLPVSAAESGRGGGKRR